ncbi:unnamed protein product, partial [Onchocerca ochengi]
KLNAMNLKTNFKIDTKKAMNLREQEEQYLSPSDTFTDNDMMHFRRVAFIAVTLSTVTTLSCIILMPISYQYVQKVQSTMLNDIEFCKCRNRDFWTTIWGIQQGKGYSNENRFIRSTQSKNKNNQWFFGHKIDDDTLNLNLNQTFQNQIRRQQPYDSYDSVESKKPDGIDGYNGAESKKPDGIDGYNGAESKKPD